MRTLILVLFLIFSFQNAVCQNVIVYSKGGVIKNKKAITTTVITINLSEPTKLSVENSDNSNKLVVPARNPLAIRLVGGNPFRYRYVLNSKTVNLFGTDGFDFSKELLDVKGDLLKKDLDGDGIPDDLDSDPSKPTPFTKEIIAAMQLKTGAAILALENNVSGYLSKISAAATLDTDGFNLSVATFTKEYQKRVLELEVLAKALPSLASSSELLSTKQVALTVQLEGVKKMVSQLRLNKNSAFLLPLDVNGDNIDYVSVQLDVFDGEDSEPQLYTYKIWIKGGVKIDVSGGVFLTSLYDRTYFTGASGSGGSVLYEEDGGAYDFGFGSMVHVSLRGGSWVRPSLDFGALFTANQKFQMLAGVGFILGKNERLILNAGISMGRVSVLRDNFRADGTTVYDLGAEGTIPLVQKFDIGHFFGVTYNFNKPKSNTD
jgi:hypothetical protein